METPLARAEAAIGGRRKVADLCEVSYSAVTQWHSNGVPPEHCRKIEDAADGKVTRYDLRPDIFGEPPQPKAPEQAAA